MMTKNRFAAHVAEVFDAYLQAESLLLEKRPTHYTSGQQLQEAALSIAQTACISQSILWASADLEAIDDNLDRIGDLLDRACHSFTSISNSQSVISERS